MPDIEKLKFLVVDDHYLARQIVLDVLREHNAENVKAVADGRAAREALEEARKNGAPYDVVFLDSSMPLLGGLDVLRHFRAQKAFDSTAFVMFTSQSEPSDVLAAVKAGATGYLIKPVSRQTIIKKLTEVGAWLDQHRAPRGGMPAS